MTIQVKPHHTIKLDVECLARLLVRPPKQLNDEDGSGTEFKEKLAAAVKEENNAA